MVNLDLISGFERYRSRLGRRWVVAVSGGSDSVALLRLLAAWGGVELIVAHLNHGTRGEASRADAEFVRQLAEGLGLPFELGNWKPTREGHFEVDARNARYEWLLEVAHNQQASVIAVGHTQDDQAETILQRIVRGTGLRGLGGIPRSRQLGSGVTLVRPLLEASRGELRQYLQGIGQTWREDASNADISRTRSRIRHELLPLLAREYNPQIVAAITRLGMVARSSTIANDVRIQELASQVVVSRDAGNIVIQRQQFATLSKHDRIEVIRSLWRAQRWPERAMDATRWRRLARWMIEGEGSYDVGYGVRLFGGLESVRLSRTRQDAMADEVVSSVPFGIPANVEWGGGRLQTTLEMEVRDQSRWNEFVDVESIELPLIVDHPRSGDRFDPLGMGGQSMALADFFRGRRVSLNDRKTTPIVRDQRGIVWVVGQRISHRVRLTETSVQIGRMQWFQAD